MSKSSKFTQFQCRHGERRDSEQWRCQLEADHDGNHDYEFAYTVYHSDRLGAVTIPEDEPRTAEDAWVEERLRIEQP